MKSMNGIEVYLHPESHPHRTDLLGEVISKITLPEDATFYRTTVDLGRIIGVDHLVEADEDHNKVVRVVRGNRAGWTPMVLDVEPVETSKVTIVLCVATEPKGYAGKWVVVTLFEGEPGLPEPWDKKCQNDKALHEKSLKFWRTHALVPANEDEWKAVIDELYHFKELYEELWEQYAYNS